MEIARAIILALPEGVDHPWSSARSSPKPLVPVANKPILIHTLHALRAAGIFEAVIFTPQDALSIFRRAVGSGERWGMRVDARGSAVGLDVAQALSLSEEFVGDEPVLVHQADALLHFGLRDHVRDHAGTPLDALVLRLPPGRMPKPDAPMAVSHLLSPRAVSIMRRASNGNDPLSEVRRRNGSVRVLDVEGCLVCHGEEATLLEANRHSLTELKAEVTDAMLENCELQGSVVVHPTASLRNTLVRGPVIIGANSQLVDSYIGPYTSIGDGAVVHGTEIEYSIIMDGAKLMFVGSRLEASIIGRGASVARRFDMPSAVRMMVGDGAEVALS